MEKPKHHIFVCCSFRATGEPQGVCYKKGAIGLLPYLENEIADRGLDGIQVSSCGCLKVCDRGPAVVVYPENWWFGSVNGESDIDAILDGIESGSPDSSRLIC